MQFLKWFCLVVLVSVGGCLLMTATAKAVMTQAPNTRHPSVQGPIDSKCNSGYSLKKYQGNKQCIKCDPDFKYAVYKGQEMCISCNPGYKYGKHNNQELCVK